MKHEDSRQHFQVVKNKKNSLLKKQRSFYVPKRQIQSLGRRKKLPVLQRHLLSVGLVNFSRLHSVFWAQYCVYIRANQRQTHIKYD